MQNLRTEHLDSEAVERFMVWLTARGKSEHTVKAYRSDLKQFMLVHSSVLHLDFEDLAMAWLNDGRTTQAAKTTGRRLTSLRAFAKWAGWGKVLEDYSLPTPAKSVPHPIPEGVEGVRAMMLCSKTPQERALIALCGLCGLRVAEALAVQTGDIDLRELTLTVRGKGDKERIVPVSTEAWQCVAAAYTTAWVTDQTTGSVVGMYDRQARRVVTRLGKKAKLVRHVSSHDLRATFATAVYDKTLDLRLVQDLLGHSSVETTQVYTGVGIAKMRGGVEL